MTDPARAARVRIGRVTMKNGGADVHVLHRHVAGPAILGQIREWADSQAHYVRPPDAFVAVAFWWDTDARQHVNHPMWATYTPHIPHAFLPALAESALSSAMTSLKAEDRVMRKLGYATVPPPDGAA